MSIADTDAGMAQLKNTFRLHQNTFVAALGASGTVSLNKGFHADVSLDAVLDSFREDGFIPVELLFATSEAMA